MGRINIPPSFVQETKTNKAPIEKNDNFSFKKEDIWVLG
jgi:hypothetical protein